MTTDGDIHANLDTTNDTTEWTSIELRTPDPGDKVQDEPSSAAPNIAHEEGARRVGAITPPQDPELEGSWEQSPLDIAVRKRLFSRSKARSSVASEKVRKRKFIPSEALSYMSAATLRGSENLEGYDGKTTESETTTDSGSPTSTKVDGRFSNQQFATPTVKNRGKFSRPQSAAVNADEQKSGTSRQSIQAKAHPPSFIYPRVDAVDPRRTLTNRNLYMQRAIFGAIVLAMNIGCLVGALKSERHLWVLIIILVVKAKDILSVLIQVGWLMISCFRSRKKKGLDVSGKWILACVTGYAETEEQIMRTINSVIDNAPEQHHMAMAVILDGKPQKILRHFAKVVQIVHRPYRTWRHGHNEVNIYTGNLKGIPIMMFEKVENAGKKDSLILCHDLFNHIRENAPDLTRTLRAEVWAKLLPQIMTTGLPQKFDFLFFTDVDSIVFEGTLGHLAQALAEEPDAIAACGLVLVDMLPANVWSTSWYFYQQFQYTFGQFVRRRAEGIWGRVTCLPGCVTMIKNRPEMGGAIALYASPITDKLVFQHQVHYLGTDRRLTWSMLEQSRHLKTLFVPEATSTTSAPNDLEHYMSQRRRWGSNAYFNDVWYMFGTKSWLITRLWAFLDFTRQTLVYYRLANTIMFIYGLSRHFLIIKLIPYIVVTQLPALWFCLFVLHDPMLRKQAHKLLFGWLINKFISPILAIMVFSRVLLNLGNTAWGRKAGSIYTLSAQEILHRLTPKRSWTPAHITTLVRNTIKERTKKKGASSSKLARPEYNTQQKPTDSTSEQKKPREKSLENSSKPVSPSRAHISSSEDPEIQEIVQRHSLSRTGAGERKG